MMNLSEYDDGVIEEGEVVSPVQISNMVLIINIKHKMHYNINYK